MKEFIQNYINESIITKSNLLNSQTALAELEKIAQSITDTYHLGGKVLIAGNGGSAADAQHIAAELVSKFMYNRDALNAIALTTNSSILTSIGNDYSHDFIFERQIQAYGNTGDIFIAISTSGNSQNIMKAAEEAKKRKLTVVGLIGAAPSKLDELCDYLIKVPSVKTSIIQESHIMLGHIICALVEREIVKSGG